jgi:hypothetical protein
LMIKLTCVSLSEQHLSQINFQKWVLLQMSIKISLPKFHVLVTKVKLNLVLLITKAFLLKNLGTFSFRECR